MNRGMTIGRRIGLGFAVVLALLLVVGGLALRGVGRIVTDAGEVISGNRLDGIMAQKEVDHLNWAGQVSALLTDDSVTVLTAQTDPHRCAFGTWLYGDDRKAAEQALPSLAPTLRDIEQYHSALHASAVEIAAQFKPADPHLPGLLAAREVDHLSWVSKVQELFVSNLAALAVEMDPARCKLGLWLAGDARRHAQADPEFARLLAALDEPHRRLHASAVAIAGEWKQVHPGLETTLLARLDDHRQWTAKVCRACALEDADFEVETDPTRCAFGRFLAGEERRRWCAEIPALKEALERCREPHDRLHASAVRIKEAFQQGDAAAAKAVYAEVTVGAMDAVAAGLHEAIAGETALVAAQQRALQVYEQETLPALADTRARLNECQAHAAEALTGLTAANRTFAEKTKPNLEKVQALLNAIRADVRKHVLTDEAMLAGAQKTRRSVLVVGCVAVLLGLVLAFTIARRICRALRGIIAGLNEGAVQVSDAAGQMSTAAQDLAEGAGGQASALEETSSALEQMAAMTRQNAENAADATALATRAREKGAEGDHTVEELDQAMQAINESSGQISRIIKVIEDIAFQTNLLALNAAVEAARAGELGKGFAVVADEVRQLAQRAADAARETTTLIEGSVSRAQQATGVAANTGQVLHTIVSDVTEAARLIDAIAKASREQSQGVDQINSAVSDIDKVTQKIAAGAEESASAAEELNAQAATVRATVAELSAMVGVHEGVPAA